MREPYIICCRVATSAVTFIDDYDRKSFLVVIKGMSERFEIDVFAYVLMGNHYHVLLRNRRANLK
jgi:hypothetical protein